MGVLRSSVKNTIIKQLKTSIYKGSDELLAYHIMLQRYVTSHLHPIKYI